MDNIQCYESKNNSNQVEYIYEFKNNVIPQEKDFINIHDELYEVTSRILDINDDYVCYNISLILEPLNKK